MTRHVPALALGLLSVVVPARAEDWYVDAVNGSDQNGGTSWHDAWRTITHAVNVAPSSGRQVFHIASGTYDTALGEQFPIEPDYEYEFVGEEGGDPPVIDATGLQQTIFDVYEVQDVVLENLVLVGGRRGVVISGFAPRATLRELALVGQTELACAVHGSKFASAVGTLERVRILGGVDGIHVSSDQNSGAYLFASDCDLTGLHGRAIRVGDSSATLRRFRIVDNGEVGIRVGGDAFYGDWGVVVLEDSLVARNREGGVQVVGGGVARIVRSTVAGNFGPGVEVNGYHGSEKAELDSSIVWGNHGDILETFGTVQAEYSDLGDGGFAGSNGNISADPLFMAPGQGEYPLRWGSPCIEAGDPATPADVADLEGLLRPIDGDLDTHEAPDMGAHEFGPLARLKPVQVHDGYLRLRLWGEDGKSTVLWAAPTALVSPQSTPFGEYDLAAGAFQFGAYAVASFPPNVVQLRLWMTLSGRTYSFQALTESSVAPQGAAWTNPIEFTLQAD